jgi:hypothetical protein
VRTLSVDRQAATVAQAPVAADVHETLDAAGDVAAEVTFNFVVALKLLADLVHFVGGEIVDVAFPADAGNVADLEGSRTANTLNIRESDIHALVAGKLNASYSCHSCTPA